MGRCLCKDKRDARKPEGVTTKEDPKVSIIIPCYHSEEFIRRCCNSIISQDYRNFEAIFVIDDLDFDKTATIIRKYNDSRFFVIGDCCKTNCATARNRGLQYANGKYVVFLDSDDWMTQDRLSKQVAYFEADKGAISGNELAWISSQVFWVRGDFPTAIISNHPGSTYLPCGITSVMFARDFLIWIRDRDGHVFDESLGSYDDYDLVLRIRTSRSEMVKQPLVYLYDNPNGLSRSESQFRGSLRLYRIVLKNIRYSWDILIPWTVSILKSPLAGVGS